MYTSTWLTGKSTCTMCTENARWLMLFSNHPATHWDGLCLSEAIVASKRQLLRHGAASLIDLRNYLFARQCHVLLQLKRPAEICQRSVPFVHNCIKELRILQVGFLLACTMCINSNDGCRMSNTPGNPGNLLEISKVSWKFSG